MRRVTFAVKKEAGSLPAPREFALVFERKKHSALAAPVYSRPDAGFRGSFELGAGTSAHSLSRIPFLFMLAFYGSYGPDFLADIRPL